MSEAAPDIALTPPASVVDDPAAIELIRIWWSNGEPAFSIKAAFKEPENFGVLLAHTLQNIAFAYANRGDMAQDEAQKRILATFAKVMSGPGIKTVLEADRVDL